MAKNRAKNTGSNSSEKPPVIQQDEVVKKIPKVSKAEESPNSKSSSGNLARCVSALGYFALVAGAAFVSFYVQRVLTEVNQIRMENEESLQKNGEMVKKVEQALQQVNSIKYSLEGLEASVNRAQADLESTNRAVRKGETETQKVEEVLQKLQNEILRDLSEGIREVKEAREHDFSSLEQTLEERLGELSRSIADSVAEFTGAQGEAQAQLSELKARLEEQNDPGVLKDELLSITTAVAQLHTANEVAEGNVGILREQIDSVRTELQTRNKEVESMSEEIEDVRSVIQSTAALLRREITGMQASVVAATNNVQSLQDGEKRASEARQILETQLREELAKTEKRENDLEARLKGTEESMEALVSSAAEQTRKFEAFLSKYDSQESSLAGQSQAAAKARQALKEEMQGLKDNLGILQASIRAVADSNSKLEILRMEALGQALEQTELENLETIEEIAEEEALLEEIGEEEVAVEEEPEAVQDVADVEYSVKEEVADEADME